MTPNGWIISSDTGISSKAIWSVMMSCAQESTDRDIPHDPGDFGRCYRLLEAIPEWKERLAEIPYSFPKWGPMIREWDKMTALYEKDLKSGKSSDLYQFMKGLYDECMIADGWKKTGSCSWEKGSAFCGEITGK